MDGEIMAINQHDQQVFQEALYSANQGNVDAMAKVGEYYIEGIGVVKNYEEAVKWLTIASEYGNPYAQWRLGFLYEYGGGVEKDEDKAFQLYMSSAQQGVPEGQYRVGKILNKRRKRDEAAEYYKLAAPYYAPAACALTWSLIFDKYKDSEPIDVEEAQKWARTTYQLSIRDKDYFTLRNLEAIYDANTDTFHFPPHINKYLANQAAGCLVPSLVALVIMALIIMI